MKRTLVGTILISGAFIAAALTNGPGIALAGATHNGPACTGTGNGLSQDFVFNGTGFQAGKNYVVAITPPNGATWYAVATADKTGSFGEYWLPETTGYYDANVFTYQSGTVGHWMTECGLTVNAW
jgi:hypothetical protein